jgi:hypothetical protein
MGRLRNIAIEERRQLITLAFAVMVFMMTLWAMQLRDQGIMPNRVVGRASEQGPSPAASASLAGNHSIGLALMTPTDSR